MAPRAVAKRVLQAELNAAANNVPEYWLGYGQPVQITKENDALKETWGPVLTRHVTMYQFDPEAHVGKGSKSLKQPSEFGLASTHLILLPEVELCSSLFKNSVNSPDTFCFQVDGATETFFQALQLMFAKHVQKHYEAGTPLDIVKESCNQIVVPARGEYPTRVFITMSKQLDEITAPEGYEGKEREAMFNGAKALLGIKIGKVNCYLSRANNRQQYQLVFWVNRVRVTDAPIQSEA